MTIPSGGDVERNITYRISVQIEQARTAFDEWRKEVENSRLAIQQIAKEAGTSFEQAAIVAQRSWENIDFATGLQAEAPSAQAFKQALGELNDEIIDTSKSTNNFSGALGQLGEIGQFVFGTILGVTALKVLQDVIQYFKQAVEEGRNFVNEVFRLGVSINGLRRAGIDITFEEVNQQIRDLRKEYTFFSETELVGGIANIQLLSRELGLTKEQIVELTDASAALSLLFGKDLTETARQVGLAISSGYSEALQRAGLNISRVTIANRALEKGLGDSFQALTNQERALVTLELVTEQLGRVYPDLAQYIETTTGQLREQDARLQDVSRSIGTKLLPQIIELREAWVSLLEFFEKAIITGTQINLLLERFRLRLQLSEEAERKAAETGREFSEVLNELVDKEWLIQVKATFPEQFGLDPADIGEGLEFDQAKIVELFKELNDEIESEQLKFTDRLADLERDLFEDLAAIDRKGNDDRAKIWRDYFDELEDINRDLNNDLAEAERDLYDDLAEIDRDYQRDILEARDDLREEELKAEREFQQELRRLRDELFFDLEEAVRNRDASQIRTLLRRYNFERDQARKNFEEQADERKIEFRNELEDIRRRRDERIRERRIAFQQELDDLRRQAEIRRREAAIEREQEFRELAIDLERDRRERFIRYQEQVRDAQIATQNRIRERVLGLVAEKEVTEELAKDIYDVLVEYFGEGGFVDELYRELRARTVAEISELRSDIQDVFSGISDEGLGTPVTPDIQIFPDVSATESSLIPDRLEPEIEVEPEINTESIQDQVDRAIEEANKIIEETYGANVVVPDISNILTEGFDEVDLPPLPELAEFTGLSLDVEEDNAVLQQRLDERIAILEEKYQAELELTQEYSESIYQVLESYFGERGFVDALYAGLTTIVLGRLEELGRQVFNYLNDLIQAISDAFSQINAQLSKVNIGGGSSSSGSGIPAFQEGGTLVATRPTLALFGEVPEVVTFTPINRTGANQGNVYGGNLPGQGGSSEVRIQVELSKDLEARLAEEISGELADVIVEVTKLRN